MLALLRIARPKGTVLLLIVPCLGYGFAHWDHVLSSPVRPLAMAVLALAWIALSAGTMWLNARLDGEEGEALFASRTPVPPRVERYGYAALAAAVALASLADARAGIVCAACAALAVAYSHPRTAWKATTLLAPLVSALGYGFLSALAGYLVTRAPLGARSLAAFALLAVAVYGLAVAAQAFQREDDARRGYRTFVVVHSPAACLSLARACVLASGAATLALMALGVFPRLCLLGAPTLFFADASMRAWQRAPRGGSAQHAVRWMTWLFAALVVFVLLALVEDRALWSLGVARRARAELRQLFAHVARDAHGAPWFAPHARFAGRPARRPTVVAAVDPAHAHVDRSAARVVERRAAVERLARRAAHADVLDQEASAAVGDRLGRVGIDDDRRVDRRVDHDVILRQRRARAAPDEHEQRPPHAR